MKTLLEREIKMSQKHHFRSLFWLLIIFAFSIQFISAQTKEIITHESMWMMKRVGAPIPSPDGKWVVFAGSGSTIQVYRMFSNRRIPQLKFVRSLHGHLGRIHSIALSDGRCVSVGTDGSVWVWDLEMDWDVQVRGGEAEVCLSGRTVFDERRILCLKGGDLEISRFDV